MNTDLGLAGDDGCGPVQWVDRPAAWTLDEIDRRKRNVYDVAVIRSFASPETERFYITGKSRRVASEIRVRAAMRLTQLDAATRLEDLRMPPSNRLEALKGVRKGQWSVCIDMQWRVCFCFDRGDAFDVEIVDYQ